MVSLLKKKSFWYFFTLQITYAVLISSISFVSGVYFPEFFTRKIGINSTKVIYWLQWITPFIIQVSVAFLLSFTHYIYIMPHREEIYAKKYGTKNRNKAPEIGTWGLPISSKFQKKISPEEENLKN